MHLPSKSMLGWLVVQQKIDFSVSCPYECLLVSRKQKQHARAKSGTHWLISAW
jgi:hypothetical protein